MHPTNNPNRIRLVHSSDNSDEVRQERETWGFENATQLQLFDQAEHSRIIIISTTDCRTHDFNEKVLRNSVSAIIDTRTFPDFFSILKSTQFALRLFKKVGIEYIHHPIRWRDAKEPEALWSKQKEFLDLISNYLSTSEKLNTSIAILVSNNSAKVLSSNAVERDEENHAKWELLM